MDWRGRRESSNIEDRRGQGGGMVRVGGVGGIGVLAVVLIGMFFGVDLTPMLNGSGGDSYSQAPSGPNTVDDDSERFVAVVLGETEDIWGAIFKASSLTYHQPKLVLFSGATRSGCGAAQSAMGPFYCPVDKTVYLDTDFFRVMEQQLGSRGEFARAYVIAHEVGHHVQDELGVLEQTTAVRARSSEAKANAISVQVELQADCYAGVWANAARDRLKLTDADIKSALDTAARIGDDALQQKSQGVVVPDSFTHGTSEQRQRWFYQGYRSGDPGQCDTFSAQSL
ncbi:MAG: neutral zinc metallopeptidase [Amaricoccus sp.]|uniref:KPN_02809 family neutral zinc metallopeptidase n=1 Tax=Amaricoccus sp. TaxID=1872485 RepID=UPI0039E658A4